MIQDEDVCQAFPMAAHRELGDVDDQLEMDVKRTTAYPDSRFGKLESYVDYQSIMASSDGERAGGASYLYGRNSREVQDHEAIR